MSFEGKPASIRLWRRLFIMKKYAFSGKGFLEMRRGV
jgi:hypothetical protein